MSFTLIGMPGSGKSFVGKKLAESLQYACIDLDIVMEQEYGRKLQDILDMLGEDAFINKEASLAIAAATLPRTIISPGGSIIYNAAAVEALRTHTTVIYLEVPYEVIHDRIGTAPRGIVGLNRMSLQELYVERLPLYERAAHCAISGDRHVDSVVADILEKISASRAY